MDTCLRRACPRLEREYDEEQLNVRIVLYALPFLSPLPLGEGQSPPRT